MPTSRRSSRPGRSRSPCPLLVLAVVLVLDPPTALVLLFTGPILVLLLAFIGGRTRVDHRAALRRGPLARRVLPRHAQRPRHAQDVRPEPRAGRHHRDDQPPVRRHDDGGAADRVPDLARARVGRRGRGRARRGRGQPAADGRRDRVRSGAGGADHRARVLPAAAARWPRATTRVRRVERSPSARSRSSTSRCRRATARRSSRRRLGVRRSPTGRRPTSAFEDVSFTLPGPDDAGARRPRPRHPAGRRGRAGRRDRRRQDDASRACCSGSSSPTPGRILVGDTAARRDRPGGLAGARRLGAAAPAPVPRHGRRQHPAGAARRHRRRGPGRRPRGRRGRLHRRPCPHGFDTPSARAGSG